MLHWVQQSFKYLPMFEGERQRELSTIVHPDGDVEVRMKIHLDFAPTLACRVVIPANDPMYRGQQLREREQYILQDLCTKIKLAL